MLVIFLIIWTTKYKLLFDDFCLFSIFTHITQEDIDWLRVGYVLAVSKLYYDYHKVHFDFSFVSCSGRNLTIPGNWHSWEKTFLEIN